MIDEYELKNGIFQLKDNILVPKGLVRLTFRNPMTGKIVSDEFVKNMYVTTGKSSVAARHAGSTTKGVMTYCALGTSVVAPALGDTRLGTELFRKLISVRSSVGNIATLQTFFTTAEANGVLTEAALFGDDADGTINSGTLFTHTVISRTKTSANTLTISWAVTIG